MSIPELTAAPDAPSTDDTAEVFNAKAFPFAAWLATLSPQMNAIGAAMMNWLSSSLTGSSADEVTIGLGAKAFPNASAGMAIVAGHELIVSSAADPANRMTGTVTSYDAGTGALELDVTSTGGAGTFADWTIGLALSADLSAYALVASLDAYLAKAGGTMTGLLTLDEEALVFPDRASNTGLATGQLYRNGLIFHFYNGAATEQLLSHSRAQSVYNKTYVNPILEGTPTFDPFTISDNASVTINPDDGEVQAWTLGANRTPTLTSITVGKAVALLVDDGAGYTIDLSAATLLNNGGVWPNLKTAGPTTFVLWNPFGTLYALLIGDAG